MFFKNMFLIFSLAQALTIKTSELPKLTSLAAVAAAPFILKYITNTAVDSDEHINSILLSLTCGNAVATFDELSSLNPKIPSAVLNTIKNSISLFLLNHIYDAIRQERVKIKENKKRIIGGLFELGLIDQSFVGKFTKYLIIYKTFNLILSKIFAQLNLKQIMSKNF